MKKPNVKCFRCSKEVYVPFNRLNTFKYCSRICKNKSNTIKIVANCKICNMVFEHISSRCNKAKYCSRKCYYISQRNKGKKEYICKFCSKKFIGHAAHNRKFCSKSCVNKCIRAEFHPKFSTVRNKMLKEGMITKCEKCGYDEIIQILGVHHINGNRNDNTQENLMVVCPMCHSILHKKHICH